MATVSATRAVAPRQASLPASSSAISGRSLACSVRLSRPVQRADAQTSRHRSVVMASKESNGNGAEKAKPDKRMKPFTNTNTFLVPEECQFQFEMEWKEREKNMNLYTGFEGLTVSRDGEDYTATSSWATVYDWEDWSTGIHHRRSHLPIGVMQYPPAKGTGFPESFVPLIGLTDKPMMAQY